MGLHKNKLKKRMLAIGCWILAFSLMAQPALALTANVRIEGPNQTIFDGNVDVPQTVTIKDSTGKSVTINGYYQVNALVKAASIGGFGFSVTDFGGTLGLSLDSINSISDPSWAHYWAQRLNWATSLGISVTPIANGDSVLIHYSTVDSNFAPEKSLKLQVSKTNLAVSEPFSLATSYYDDDTSTFKPTSATLQIGDQTAETDQNGNLTTSIAKEGVYNIRASKPGFVRSNKARVLVGRAFQIKVAKNKSVSYLRKRQLKIGKIENPGTSAWAVLAFASAKVNPNKIKIRKGKFLIDYLRSYRPRLATDYARQILAVVAARRNPRNFGRKNLLKRLTHFFRNNNVGDKNLLNDDTFAALALLAARIPNRRMVEAILATVVQNQHPDGGFSYAKNVSASDIDDTAAVVQALTAAKRQGYQGYDEAITRALSFLRGSQNDDGGFGFTKTGAFSRSNSMSTSWAIQAITSAGEDVDFNWAKPNGATPYSYLLSLQASDGSFKYNASGQKLTLATAYAVPALLGKPWPIK